LDESAEQSPLERFCALLADHSVEFIVVASPRRWRRSISPCAGHHPT